MKPLCAAEDDQKAACHGPEHDLASRGPREEAATKCDSHYKCAGASNKEEDA